MPLLTRAQLNALWLTGYTPTQADYTNWRDSFYHKNDLIPSDIVVVDNLAALPPTGTAGRLYVVLDVDGNDTPGLRIWFENFYNDIIPTATGGGGGTMTAVEIRDALQTLTLTDRLSATAIQGLPVLPPIATQAEVEAGTETATRLFSPLLIAQAIAELSPSGNAGSFSLSQGNATISGEYVGTNAPTSFTSPSAGIFVLVVPAGTKITWLNAFGDNTVLDGFNQFILRIDHSADGVNRRYSSTQYIRANGAEADVFQIGTNPTTSITSSVTEIIFPSMSGYGSTGFDIVLN